MRCHYLNWNFSAYVRRLLITSPINFYLLNLSTSVWQAKNCKLLPEVGRLMRGGNFLCNLNQFISGWIYFIFVLEGKRNEDHHFIIWPHHYVIISWILDHIIFMMLEMVGQELTRNKFIFWQWWINSKTFGKFDKIF